MQWGAGEPRRFVKKQKRRLLDRFAPVLYALSSFGHSGSTLKVKAENRGRHPMFIESAKLLVWLIPVLLLALIFLPQMMRILREYERGVISVSANCSPSATR
jgi:hypothetical protein